jgi:hypothetical protein
VTTDELSCGVNNDVCSVLDRTYQIRGCKGIINYQRNLVCVCNVCESLDVYNIGVRVSKGLYMDCLGVILNG